MAELSINTIARFWSKVDVGRETECWPWRGGTGDSGHGRFKIDGKLYSPHRIAYQIATGDIPEGDGYHGTVVRHGCDNPSCCNPGHLTDGTQADNVRDMDERGRRRIDLSLIVTPGVADAIRRDPRPQRIIAKTYGISKTYVGAIKRGERRHEPAPLTLDVISPVPNPSCEV